MATERHNTGEYKRHKGLTKENLRDNMTNVELALNTLAEVTATEISRQRNPKGMAQSRQTAKEGGEVARNARADIESRLGHSVISSQRATDYWCYQPLRHQSQIQSWHQRVTSLEILLWKCHR